MKKTFLMLGISVLAVLASCKKEASIVSDVLEIINAPSETTIAKEGKSTEDPIVVTFKASKPWTAVAEQGNGNFVTLSPKAGEPADVCTLKVGVAENDTEADRDFKVIIQSEGLKPIELSFTQQSQFHMNIAATEYDVSKDGDEFTITVDANVEFTVDDKQDVFTWQHVVPSNDGKTYKVTIDANGGYDPRTSYVKFTTTQIQDEEGNDLVIRVNFKQEGLPCIKYTISMYDANFDTWGTTVLSEAIYNGKHYVSNGQDLYEINPADGTYKKTDWPWGSGMTQKVITNDDAGNLIVCNHTEYTEDYLDGYFILNVVTPAGEEKNLITKAAWECGGPFGARLEVRGDITSNAIIVAPVEGIAGVLMSCIIGYWEVNNGNVGDYVKLDATGFVGAWGEGAWSTYPQNFPTILAKGVTASEGFVMSGIYEENAVYAIDGTTGICYKMLVPDLFIGEDQVDSNLGCQSMSMNVVGGKAYLAILASSFFPSYGPGWTGAPYLAIIEVPASLPSSPLNMWDSANLVKICTTYFPWKADPATDWAISVAADVNLFDANGKLGIALTDLNGRSIECYEFDPAVIAK